MKIVCVPNSLDSAINKRLDAAYSECPGAAADRDSHYQALLAYFDDHGVIPDFTLKKNEKAEQ